MSACPPSRPCLRQVIAVLRPRQVRDGVMMWSVAWRARGWAPWDVRMRGQSFERGVAGRCLRLPRCLFFAARVHIARTLLLGSVFDVCRWRTGPKLWPPTRRTTYCVRCRARGRLAPARLRCRDSQPSRNSGYVLTPRSFCHASTGFGRPLVVCAITQTLHAAHSSRRPAYAGARAGDISLR